VGRGDDDAQTAMMQEIAWGEEAETKQGGVPHICLGILSSVSVTISEMIMWGCLTSGVYFACIYAFEALNLKSTVEKGIAGMLVTLFTLVMAMVIAIVIKRVLLPRFIGRYPMWSRPFMAWQAFSIVMGSLSGTIVPLFQGTCFMAIWLRCIGAKVGSNLYMDTPAPVETDCLDIGDNCIILPTAQALVPHTIDRGMIQWAPIKLGNDVCLGFNSCVMAMADVREEACVGPMSVVLKAELIPAKMYAHGNPLVMTREHHEIAYAISGDDARQRQNVAAETESNRSSFAAEPEEQFDVRDAADSRLISRVKSPAYGYGSTRGEAESSMGAESAVSDTVQGSWWRWGKKQNESTVAMETESNRSSFAAEPNDEDDMLSTMHGISSSNKGSYEAVQMRSPEGQYEADAAGSRLISRAKSPAYGYGSTRGDLESGKGAEGAVSDTTQGPWWRWGKKKNAPLSTQSV